MIKLFLNNSISAIKTLFKPEKTPAKTKNNKQELSLYKAQLLERISKKDVEIMREKIKKKVSPRKICKEYHIQYSSLEKLFSVHFPDEKILMSHKEFKDNIISLYNKGFSYARISKITGYSYTNVYTYLLKNNALNRRMGSC